MQFYVKSYALIAVFLLAPLIGHAHDEAGVTTKLILSTTETVSGQPLSTPANARLQVVSLTIAPGMSLPVHKHPYPRFAYVKSGEIEVTLVDGNKTILYKTGEFIVETVDKWHFGTNKGTEPVELIVIDQMPQEAKTNTVMQAAAKP